MGLHYRYYLSNSILMVLAVAFLGLFGDIWVTIWEVLEGPGGHLGRSGGLLGRSWGLLGASWTLCRPRDLQEFPRTAPNPTQDGPKRRKTGPVHLFLVSLEGPK